MGTIVGALMDACVPQLHLLPTGKGSMAEVGLARHEGSIGEREGYPDYLHSSGKRVELKLLYVDPIGVQMKRPPTPREASARLTQKVTVKNVDAGRDVLLVLAYQLQPSKEQPALYTPTIIDLGVFSMAACINARDQRLADGGGRWFGNYETPVVLSKRGRHKVKRGRSLRTTSYGRKESEARDYNEDTNFGKLKRIPHKPLQEFLKKHGATYARRGTRADPWKLE